MSQLVIVFILFYSVVGSANTLEMLYRPAAGKHDFTLSLESESNETNRILVSDPDSTSVEKDTSTALSVDYAFGINEEMVAGLNVGYLMRSEEESHLDSANNSEAKSDGVTDMVARFGGFHDFTDAKFHWGFRLGLALESAKSKTVSVGPPEESEGNASSGRNSISGEMAYAFGIGESWMGLRLGLDLYNKEARIVNDNTEIQATGGDQILGGIFFEAPSGANTLGLDLEYNTTSDIKVKYAGATLFTLEDQIYLQLKAYSRWQLEGLSLLASIGYRQYNASGGRPASYKIDGGNGLLATIGLRF